MRIHRLFWSIWNCHVHRVVTLVIVRTHDFTSPINSKCCYTPLGRNSKVKLWPQICGVRVDIGDRKRFQPKCRPHIPIRFLYTLRAYLAPFGHKIQRGGQKDRQSDVIRPPTQYSIGDLKPFRDGGYGEGEGGGGGGHRRYQSINRSP